MDINSIVLIICVSIAVSAVITGSVMKLTQKRKEDANKTLSVSQILVYSAELTNKIYVMLDEFAHISMTKYETDSQFRATLINKTISVITQTLAQHNITIPVDPEVLQSLAALLVEKAITAVELKKESDKISALSIEIAQAKEELASITAAPVYEDHSKVEIVDLGEL